MMRQILSVAWKDLKVLSKDSGALVTLLGMPAIFIFIMSLALAGQFGSGGGGRPIDLLVVNEDSGGVGAQIIEGLRSAGGFNVETSWDGAVLTLAQAEELVRTQRRDIAIFIPAGFSESVQRAAFGPAAAQAPPLELIADPALSSQLRLALSGALAGLSEQAAMGVLAPRGIDLMLDQLAQGGASLPSAVREQIRQQAARGMGAAGTRVVQVSTRQPTGMQIEKFPTVLQQNVPGFTLFGVFFISQILATSIMEEKAIGTFRRLLAAPLPRAAFLLGKLAAYMVVSLIQVALMFAVGIWLMPLVAVTRLELGPHPVALVPISIAASLAATGLGLLFAAIARTAEQVSGLGTLLVIVLAALGGVMVPRFVMPKFMQDIGLISPHAWALNAYQDVMVRGSDVGGVIPEVGALLGFAALFFAIAVWRFRWD